MLIKVNAVLLIIVVSSLLFIGYTLVNEYSTTVRWQAEAISKYKQQKADWDAWKSPTPPPKKQEWWHENPIFVAVGAWADLGGNLLAILICTSSVIGKLGIGRRVRRLKREKKKKKTHVSS